jgi:hypothetical protein
MSGVGKPIEREKARSGYLPLDKVPHRRRQASSSTSYRKPRERCSNDERPPLDRGWRDATDDSFRLSTQALDACEHQERESTQGDGESQIDEE